MFALKLTFLNIFCDGGPLQWRAVTRLSLRSWAGMRNIVVGLSYRKLAFVHLPTNQIFASQTKRASERDLVPSERETGF